MNDDVEKTKIIDRFTDARNTAAALDQDMLLRN